MGRRSVGSDVKYCRSSDVYISARDHGVHVDSFNDINGLKTREWIYTVLVGSGRLRTGRINYLRTSALGCHVGTQDASSKMKDLASSIE